MFIADELVDRLRAASLAEAFMAAEQVTTASGAVRLFNAERLGLSRRPVLRTIERRIAQLSGEMPDGQRTTLVTEGRSVETASLNQTRPRVVAGAGRGTVSLRNLRQA
jgi:hypothetical protein